MSRTHQDEMEHLYGGLPGNSRYQHYARIAGRICRCLDYFNVCSNRKQVKERLECYYLFIGVVDDAIDSLQIDAGREILARLKSRTVCFDEETKGSCAKRVTEMLKPHISSDSYPVILARLEE